MIKRITGEYYKFGNLTHFLPYPLPPKSPEFHFNSKLITLYGEAMHAIGRLNEISKRLPNKERFIKAYCIKESILSSAIEGINTTIAQIYTQEVSTVNNANKQTQLVLNYHKALNECLRRINKDQFPITSRILLLAHNLLMSEGEGDKSRPGEYRKSQVTVGDFIPPTYDKILDLMADLEKYINNNDNNFPPLIKAGLTHLQFETIHPFLDGNGRIGRLLIILMLMQDNVLNSPILYPSVYFKKFHSTYYEKLNNVRLLGDFEGWIEFYLDCIRLSASDGYQRVSEIEILESSLKDTLIKPNQNHLKAIEILFSNPVTNISQLQSKLGTSYNTAAKIIEDFINSKIISETTSKKRNKLFSFDKYLELLDKEFIQEKLF